MGRLSVRKNRTAASLLPLLYAVAGGLFATLGALVEEGSAGTGFLLGVVVIGPFIEEILKPMGVIFLLEKNSPYLHTKTQIFWLCIVGAVVFAFMENMIYAYVYLLPLKHNPVLYKNAVLYRYTVCVFLHAAVTSIIAMGLAKEFVRIRETGEKFLLENITSYIVAAVSVHGGYNLLASIIGPSLR